MGSWTSKAEIDRTKVHDKNMKIVIIRLDYAGVTDLLDLIKSFDQTIKSFKQREEVYNNQLNLNIREEDIQTISKTLSIPVNIIRKEKIYRYSNAEFGECQTTLDISQYFLCMTIISKNNYDGLTVYSQVFQQTAELFKTQIKFFNPKRLGLRKTRVENFNTIDEIQSTFEPNLFCFNHFNDIPDKEYHSKIYKDVFRNDQLSIFANINRSILPVKKDDQDKLQTQLDIDTYYDTQHYKTIFQKFSFAQLLENANQYEFEIYKSCLTLEHLNKISD